MTKTYYASETKDYSRFKFLETENRPIREDILKNLEPEILKNGICNPIEVDGDYNIYDGQHRFVIARKHGLALPYLVNRKLTLEMIPSLQKATRWNAVDYCRVLANSGNVNCQRAIYVAEEWNKSSGGKMTVSRALEILMDGRGSTNLKTKLQNETYSINEGYAYMVYDAIKILDSYRRYIAGKAVTADPYGHKVARALKSMCYDFDGYLDLDVIERMAKKEVIEPLANENAQAKLLVAMYTAYKKKMKR